MNILLVIKVKSLMLVKWSCRSANYVHLTIYNGQHISRMYTVTLVMSPSVMSVPLLYPETLGKGCALFNLPLCCHISLTYTSWVLTSKESSKRTQTTHTRMHHVVVIVIIISTATLTLCYSIMSHATLTLYYHASMLILQTSLISRAL